MNSKQFFLIFGPMLALFTYLFIDLPLPHEGKVVVAITVLAIVYWFSEAIALHVTGLLISFLLIVTAGFSPKEIFPHYFNPVIVLLLGGFMLAVALQKYKLDHDIAHRSLNFLGSNPKKVLLGFMFLTAFLSFWISNTASAAVMIPIVLFILAKNKLDIKNSNFSKAFILGVAYAATAGGIGTLVGSTPNPLAASAINDLGIKFGFFDWVFYGLPFVIVFLFVIWFVVLKIYNPEITELKIEKEKQSFSKQEKMVLGIFGLTIFLWATDSITGLHSSVVALVPVLLLYFTGLVNTEDFKKINWPILSLIGSGIVLGFSFQQTGIDIFIASSIGILAVGQPLFVVMFVIAIVGVLVTMFASNTASAALMIPLSIPLAPVLGIKPEVLIVLTAIAASVDFTAPMGTPPNAIAYSTGAIKVTEMARTGLLLSLIASLLLAVFATFFW